MTYLALLRAINVGGRRVKMDKLRALFEELGFGHVRTYIQTGNVFFDTEETNLSLLTQKIENHLRKQLGFEVFVFIRNRLDLNVTLQNNPFFDQTAISETRFYIMFISKPLQVPIDLPFRVNLKGMEMILLSATEGELFVKVTLLDGIPGNPMAWIEKNWQISVTARFFDTTLKMLSK